MIKPTLTPRVIEIIRSEALEMLSGDAEKLPMSCLYHALAVNKILGAPVLAGSSQWRFTSLDDGKNSTHFSYMFTPSTTIVPLLLEGILPEMHIWNFYEGKVLDLTTKYLPTQCINLLDRIWEKELLPPDYYFGEAVTKDQNIIYVPSHLATSLLFNQVLKTGREK